MRGSGAGVRSDRVAGSGASDGDGWCGVPGDRRSALHGGSCEVNAESRELHGGTCRVHSGPRVVNSGPRLVHSGRRRLNGGAADVIAGPRRLHASPCDVRGGTCHLSGGRRVLRTGPCDVHSGPFDLRSGLSDLHRGPCGLNSGPFELRSDPTEFSGRRSRLNRRKSPLGTRTCGVRSAPSLRGGRHRERRSCWSGAPGVGDPDRAHSTHVLPAGTRHGERATQASPLCTRAKPRNGLVRSR